MTRSMAGAKLPAGFGSAGRRVALLAPLSGANAERGQALAAAAKLALAEPGSPPLDVLDTGSTPAGAAGAARQAVAGGAGIIIGPLTSGETSAAAAVATPAGVPILPFTNDSSVAKPGVWPLGITPTQQVRRLVGVMTSQGRSRFAALLPGNDFGHAMGNALTTAVGEAGLSPPSIRYHSSGMESTNAAMRDISGYASRRGPLDAQIRAARSQHTAEGRKEAAELSRRGVGAAPMDVLLLGDIGEGLGTVTSLLAYYDIYSPQVRIVGPALWAATSGAPAGAMYAAPDPSLRQGFSDSYAQANGGTPAPGLADLAYDAAAIARVAAATGSYGLDALCRPEGFAGVDGVLGLLPDGTVRRGLAVFQIQGGGAGIVDPAPSSLSAAGI